MSLQGETHLGRLTSRPRFAAQRTVLLKTLSGVARRWHHRVRPLSGVRKYKVVTCAAAA